MAYRAYVTDALQLAGQSKYPALRWVEIIEGLDRPVDTRTAEEIAADVMMRAGLRFADECI